MVKVFLFVPQINNISTLVIEMRFYYGKHIKFSIPLSFLIVITFYS